MSRHISRHFRTRFFLMTLKIVCCFKVLRKILKGRCSESTTLNKVRPTVNKVRHPRQKRDAHTASCCSSSQSWHEKQRAELKLSLDLEMLHRQVVFLVTRQGSARTTRSTRSSHPMASSFRWEPRVSSPHSLNFVLLFFFLSFSPLWRRRRTKAIKKDHLRLLTWMLLKARITPAGTWRHDAADIEL